MPRLKLSTTKPTTATTTTTSAKEATTKNLATGKWKMLIVASRRTQVESARSGNRSGNGNGNGNVKCECVFVFKFPR